MQPLAAVIPALAICSACTLFGEDEPREPDPRLGCVADDVRATTTVTVSGTVRDFETLAPVAGATVDLTTAWDVPGTIPAPKCPLVGSVTTDADGRFGPVEVLAGSSQAPPILLFIVRGGDRAPTMSDNRTCDAPTCDLVHDIAAPSTAQAARWRTDLADGGMTNAASRGLIAFLYKLDGGAPAEGVEPLASVEPVTLRPGLDVRFVDPDRAALLPVAQATTSSSGVAVIGVLDAATAVDPSVLVAGRRGADVWAAIGALVADGFIFVEDRTISPPSQP